MRAIETILRDLTKSDRDLAKEAKKNQLLHNEYHSALNRALYTARRESLVAAQGDPTFIGEL